MTASRGSLLAVKTLLLSPLLATILAVTLTVTVDVVLAVALTAALVHCHFVLSLLFSQT